MYIDSVKHFVILTMSIVLLVAGCAPVTTQSPLSTDSKPSDSTQLPIGGTSRIVSTLFEDLDQNKSLVLSIDKDGVCLQSESCTVAAGQHSIFIEYIRYNSSITSEGPSALSTVARLILYIGSGILLEPHGGNRSSEIKCQGTINFTADPEQEYRLGARTNDTKYTEFFVEEMSTRKIVGSDFCQ